MSNKFMLEEEMESYLAELGYDIWYDLDGGKVVDSTLVIQYAVDDLGYVAKENADGIYEFRKI